MICDGRRRGCSLGDSPHDRERERGLLCGLRYTDVLRVRSRWVVIRGARSPPTVCLSSSWRCDVLLLLLPAALSGVDGVGVVGGGNTAQAGGQAGTGALTAARQKERLPRRTDQDASRRSGGSGRATSQLKRTLPCVRPRLVSSIDWLRQSASYSVKATSHNLCTLNASLST